MRITGIIWLRDIVDKLAWKHNVAPEEVEQIFEGAPRYRFMEAGDVAGENLYAAFGQTDAGRYLVIFFIRKMSDEALVISARDMLAREKRQYDK